MKKNKWIGISAAVLAVAVGGFAVMNTMASDTSLPVNYTTISPSELVNSISAKGIVESVKKSNVYSTVSGTIKTVNVEVGDKVTEGQILCELDTEDLELNIAGQVASSDSSIKTAKVNLESAQKNYNDALKEYEDGTDSQITNAESNLVNAKLDLDNKQKVFENNKILFISGNISNNEYTQSENAYTTAQNNYNNALTSLDNAKTSQDKSLEQLLSALKTAQINYNSAIASKDSAGNGGDSKVIAIQKLEKQLADSSIKAPMSGTVTAVYAKEGANGAGLLFVVEDTDNLKITTKIKEYDVGKIKVGMPVTIKSDSTGEAVYEGIISKIEPTAVKNANGETASSSDVEFGAEIKVTSSETDLKVGMNTRLNVILEKRENVYCVPYDAISTNKNGESVVYTAVSDGTGKYTAKQIVVTTGLETDFYVEISGNELSQDMQIISDASKVQDNMKITLN